MPIPRSEAPDPEKFVREQLARHVGHSVDDYDDWTNISGVVVRSIMEALEEKIKPAQVLNSSSIQVCGSYTLLHCINFVRARISSQCTTE